MDSFVSPCKLRQSFANSLSEMYRAEVPAYDALLALVRRLNSAKHCPSSDTTETTRIGDERHGAIRLAHPAELLLIRRALAVLGMYPVGYYDLSPAGLPVHSTAFRPIRASQMSTNAFRLFTSLVRLDQIKSAGLRKEAERLITKRCIVSEEGRSLIDVAERQGGLKSSESEIFVRTLMDTFRWRGEALASFELYQESLEEHPLIADVICFPNPHINHLTPRVWDIDAAQQQMIAEGLPAKEKIEGPPKRECPILLRQTAFRALKEPVRFTDMKGESLHSSHTARFGEIESRGAALTAKGMALYHRCTETGSFEALPDDWGTLRAEKMAWFEFERVEPLAPSSRATLNEQIDGGEIVAKPITYEDFLPVSAAGIFRSNLGAGTNMSTGAVGSQTEFEKALGQAVIDPQDLYSAQSINSFRAVTHNPMTVSIDQ